MAKLKIRPIAVLYWAAWATVDFLLFIFLSTALMEYDDNYDSSKGEYGSLASMNTAEKTVHFVFILWMVFNVALVCHIGFKIYKTVR